MLPVHTILFPTDFSETAQHAFPMACSLARQCGARLVVLYVMPRPVGHDRVLIEQRPEEYYKEPLAALHAVQAPDGDVRVEHRLEDGDASTKIVEVAAELNAGLIILGSHGRTGVGRLLLGSVAEAVLRDADCAVLVVKNTDTTGKLQTILAPTDFSNSSTAALDIAFGMAHDLKAHLIVLHVEELTTGGPYEEFESRLEATSSQRRSLEEQLRSCRKPSCNADFRMAEGETVAEILRVANESGCDLIVMGTHGRTGLRRMILGSVAENVLRRARCPVLLLKSRVPTPTIR